MRTLLDELLEDIVDNVEDAESNLGEGGTTPNLADFDLVAEHIDTALDRIDSALEIIGDTGGAEPVEAPETLDQIARQCVVLAEEALRMHTNGELEEVEQISARLRTIRHLITTEEGYRNQAGLT